MSESYDDDYDEMDQFECIDRYGSQWPEHDYHAHGCRRCGAEDPLS